MAGCWWTPLGVYEWQAILASATYTNFYGYNYAHLLTRACMWSCKQPIL